MSAAESAQPRARPFVWQYPQSPWRIGPACGDRTLSGECGCAGHCSFRLLLIKNRRDQIRWDGLKGRRLHRITRAAFRQGPDRRRISEQFSQRHHRVNDHHVAARLDAVDGTTPTAQVAANITLIFFWRDVLDLHDRLQQDWFALLEAVFHRENRRHLECELVGIDFVERAVNDVHFHIDNGITAQHAVEPRFVDSLLHRRDVFPRNDASHDLVLDYETVATRTGTH